MTQSREEKQAIRNVRAAFFDGAAGTAEGLVVATRWGTFAVDVADTRVGRKLFVNLGRSEMKALRRVVRVLGRKLKGDVFVDVGANIGTTTVPALLTHGFDSAIAIEPAEANVRLLRANLALNALEQRATVIPVAVSDAPGVGTLQLHSFNSGAHRLDPLPAGEDGFAGSVEVPLVSLDALVRDGAIDPDAVSLLWLDVQGHEGSVLAGAGSLLERSRPVVFELDASELDEESRTRILAAAAHYQCFLDLRSPASVRPGRTRELARLVDPDEAGGGVTDVLLF